MEKRMDKTVLRKQSLFEADMNEQYWRTKSFEKRLQAAYFLSLRVDGYDPDAPPKMDKGIFKMRQRESM